MRAAKTLTLLFLSLSCIQQAAAGEEPLFHQTSGRQIPLDKPDSGKPALEIVELVFNGKSAGTCRCFFYNDLFWIPFELLAEKTAIEPLPESAGTVNIPTTIGVLSFDSGKDLRQFENHVYISTETLEKKFFITSKFNQQYYSFGFDIPWRVVKKVTVKNNVQEDFLRAPDLSLSFLHLEGNFLYETGRKAGEGSHFLFESGGRVAGGIWDIVAEKGDEHDPDLSRFHWTSYKDNAVMRIGTGSTSPYFLLPDIPFTGIQGAWSNRTIIPYIDNTSGTKNDSFLVPDREQSRSIEGSGPVAGIAELRIDGIVSARQRIGLDGKYVFSDVRMYSDFRSMQVFLYQRSLLEKPVKIIDFSRSVLNRTLGGGELLVKAGAGTIRNHGAGGYSPDLFFGQVLYGLSDRITLEGNTQYNYSTGGNDYLLGAALSLGANWAVSLYGAGMNGLSSAEARVEGHYPFGDLHYRGLFSQVAGDSGRHLDQSQQLRLTGRLFRNFTALLYGQYEKTPQKTSLFMLPGFFWQPHPSVRITTLPDFDRNYHYETWVKLRENQDLTLSYSEKEHSLNAEYRYDFSQYMHFRIEEGYLLKSSASVSSIFFEWNPESSFYHMISVGASYSSGQAGYAVSWHKYLNAGLQFRLTYSGNLPVEKYISSIDDPLVFPADHKNILCATFSWDLGVSGKKLRAVNREELGLTRGGISGAFVPEKDSPLLDEKNIEGINVLVNGQQLSQRQLDGSFFIGDLKQGLYDISFDIENLPIDINISTVRKKIEVRPCAVTTIEIPVYAQYGVAGKIECLQEDYHRYKLEIVSAGNGSVVAERFPNEFGYYRVDGLRPGEYIINVEKIGSEATVIGERRITIHNSFLFGVDISW